MQIRANKIIEEFGGVCRMAKALGIWPSVVQGWKNRNKIPIWRMSVILSKAAEMNIDLADIDDGEE